MDPCGLFGCMGLDEVLEVSESQINSLHDKDRLGLGEVVTPWSQPRPIHQADKISDKQTHKGPNEPTKYICEATLTIHILVKQMISYLLVGRAEPQMHTNPSKTTAHPCPHAHHHGFEWI